MTLDLPPEATRDSAARAADAPARDPSLARLQALAALSEIFAKPVALEEALRQTARLASHAVGDWALLHRVVDDGEAIVAVAAHHRDPRHGPDVAQILLLDGARRPIGVVAGASRVARTGVAELYPRISPEQLEAFAGSPERLAVIQRVGCSSMAVVPLRTPSGILGTLAVGTGVGSPPVDASDLAFAAQLADRVAAAIARDELTAQLQRERETLAKTLADTERQRASLEVLVRHAPVGVAFLDPDLRFVLANEMIATLDGLPAPFHPGRTLESVWPSQLAPMVQDLRAALEQGDSGVRHELTVSRAGEPRYLDAAYYPVRAADGALLGVTAIVSDQTAQVRARRRIEELAAAEQRRAAELLTLLHANPNPTVVLGADDCVRHVSAAFGQLMGLAPQTLTGLPAAALVERMVAAGVREPGPFRAAWERLLADRTLVLTDEVDFGEQVRRSFRRTSTPVLSPAGGYLGRLVVLVEVTAERELDRERTEFLTVASHELKTPLTPLSIGLQALERRLARGEPVGHELVAKARRQLARLNALIDDLLDFSRVETGRLELQPQLLRLDALCADVVGDLAASSPNHLVQWLPPPAAVRVRGDRHRLEQVLVNLVQNAVKYSPQGGSVQLGLRVAGGEAVIEVRDDGIGILPEDQGRLFERFFRGRNATARQFGGLGIGLHVAREIVQRHGGRFEVESAPHRGSTFRFYLPCAPEVGLGPALCFVDDGAEDFAPAREALEAEGFAIDRVALEVALERLEARQCEALVVDLGSFGEGWRGAWARLRTAAIWTTAFLCVLPPGVAATEGEPHLARPFEAAAIQSFLRERLAAAAASRQERRPDRR